VATTNATLPPRISSLSARPLSSITSVVSSTELFRHVDSCAIQTFACMHPPNPIRPYRTLRVSKSLGARRRVMVHAESLPTLLREFKSLSTRTTFKLSPSSIKRISIFKLVTTAVSSTEGDKILYVVFCRVMCESAPADDILSSSWAIPLVLSCTRMLSALTIQHTSKLQIGMSSSLAKIAYVY
jgi:hypothetical protein